MNRIFRICATFPSLFIFYFTLLHVKKLCGLRHCNKIGSFLIQSKLSPCVKTPGDLQMKIRTYTQRWSSRKTGSIAKTLGTPPLPSPPPPPPPQKKRKRWMTISSFSKKIEKSGTIKNKRYNNLGWRFSEN